MICGYKFKKISNIFEDYVNTFFEDKLNAKSIVERNIAKLMLNSLYGKFGMKDIENTLKIVSHKTAINITKNYNYSMLSNLSNGNKLIKYSNRISSDLRNAIKENTVTDIKDNKGLFKLRGVPSAIQIAVAISGYSKNLMHKYKNIPNNPCIYTDTDSVVLQYPLDPLEIGTEIGKMKLENKVKKGIFARKKLYCIINESNEEIVKSSGIDSKELNFEDIVKISKGIKITKLSTVFNVDWNELEVKVVDKEITFNRKYFSAPPVA
jgi:DNA polymerase type B, organellar and viral